MSKKFKVWLDSGANNQSCYETEISLDELDISDKDWSKMTEDEQEEIMKDIAFDRADWGYTEIED